MKIIKQVVVKKFIILGLLFMLRTNCSKEEPPPPPPPPPEEPSFEGRATSFHVHIDASLSMGGFVVGGNTQYTQVIQCLLQVVSQLATPHIYQFGSMIQEITEGDFFSNSNSTDFYRDPNICKETRIGSVIEQYQRGSFFIIVTNLFQHQGNVNLLLAKIREKFTDPGMRWEY